MKPKFPLLGPRTAVYAALFWTDRFPQYMKWGYELLERIRGAADVTLLVTDGNLTEPPPDYVEQAVVREQTGLMLRDCFATAVEELAARDVGAFYYIGIDNLYDVSGICGMLGSTMKDADLTFTDLAYTGDRWDQAEFPIPKEACYGHTHNDCYRFSVNVHSWPDASCFRTSMFTEFPLSNEPREFIRHTLKTAADAGKHPKAVYRPEYAFYYFSHDHCGLDRSFIQSKPEEVHA